jgi:hypothetical protein
MNHVTDERGNIYVSGKTSGNISGINMGLNDGFITKTDSSGNVVWKRQFGSEGDEDVLWSAIDRENNIYITGSTTGKIGNSDWGREDIFVVKYNESGELQWKQQFGTDSTDIARGICCTADGYIYLSGSTNGRLGEKIIGNNDCFIMKLDKKGRLIKSVQFGTAEDDQCFSISGFGKKGVCVCGTTRGDLDGKNRGFIDGFTAQFTGGLVAEKFIQFGSDGFDIAMAIKSDRDKNIYTGGSTSGNFGGTQTGNGDAFLIKFSKAGETVWNIQFGTENNDGLRGICLAQNRNADIVVSGVMGLPPANAFVRIYSKDGKQLWERNISSAGIKGDSSGKDVSIDRMGNIIQPGLTQSDLFGRSSGESDWFLVKYRYPMK